MHALKYPLNSASLSVYLRLQHRTACVTYFTDKTVVQVIWKWCE